jgi:hypothetical protein
MEWIEPPVDRRKVIKDCGFDGGVESYQTLDDGLVVGFLESLSLSQARSDGPANLLNVAGVACTIHAAELYTSPDPQGRAMTPVTVAQLRTAATAGLMTVARALGLGRTKACALARPEQFPCRVIRIGDSYRVSTGADLLEMLGVSVEDSGS